MTCFLPAYSGIKEVNYDYGLVHLKEDFKLSPHIDTICLPDYPGERKGK